MVVLHRMPCIMSIRPSITLYCSFDVERNNANACIQKNTMRAHYFKEKGRREKPSPPSDGIHKAHLKADAHSQYLCWRFFFPLQGVSLWAARIFLCVADRVAKEAPISANGSCNYSGYRCLYQRSVISPALSVLAPARKCQRPQWNKSAINQDHPIDSRPPCFIAAICIFSETKKTDTARLAKVLWIMSHRDNCLHQLMRDTQPSCPVSGNMR